MTTTNMYLKMNRTFRNIFNQKAKQNFGKYNVVKPGNVSPQMTVPDNIPKPSYHLTGQPADLIPCEEIKNAVQISKMRDSCRLAAGILNDVERFIQAGKTTDDIDKLVFSSCVGKNAYPSPLNYRQFPKSVCTSVNNVACHGIPDDRPLHDGDIVNVDVTVFYNGYHGDCSRTFMVGNVDEEGRNLVQATEICLHEGVSACKPGEFFRTIGAVIEENAQKLGYRIVPAFLGHGIGHYFHGPPDIFHFRNNYPGRMEAGMTFTIEPILTQGKETIDILEDNWTAVTVDNSRTAQFEHTVLITDDGVEILTKCDS